MPGTAGHVLCCVFSHWCWPVSGSFWAWCYSHFSFSAWYLPFEACLAETFPSHCFSVPWETRETFPGHHKWPFACDQFAHGVAVNQFLPAKPQILSVDEEAGPPLGEYIRRRKRKGEGETGGWCRCHASAVTRAPRSDSVHYLHPQCFFMLLPISFQPLFSNPASPLG